MRAHVIVAGLVMLTAIATAQPADPAALRATGEALARGGRYAEAIELFKQADRIKPNAANACLIALAYTRRELWPQAEVWLDKCRARATPADPQPDWAPAEAKQIRERLAVANVAPVEIVVMPPDAEVTVSSFALDESFAPRTIHLPLGRHAFVATAPGYEEGHAELVVDDRAPKRVVIELRRKGIVVRGPRALRMAGFAAGGAAIVAAGAGVVFGLQARADAATLSTHTAGMWQPTDEQTFADGRTANRRMIGAYAIGGALLATGGILYYLGARTHLEPFVTPTSASVAIEGRF